MDTLPTAEQWKVSLARPEAAKKSFRWPLLANVELATGIISAYGGGKWCCDLMGR